MTRTSARVVSLLFFLVVVVSMYSATAVAQSLSPREQLQQYISDLHKRPDDQALREKIIKLALTLEPKPAVPEEARRHFVRGNTALKEARDSSDYDRAIARYNDALLLAPWWPEPYFNLAKALELRERYDDAIAALKLYLLAAPQAEDARAAQDMIYALEDKKERRARVADAEKRKREQEDQARRAKAGQFDYLIGRWRFIQGNYGWPGYAEGTATIRKSGNYIEANDQRGFIFLRGTIQDSGDVVWEHFQHQECGWERVHPTFRPDQRQFGYAHFTASDRPCRYSTIRTFTKE